MRGLLLLVASCLLTVPLTLLGASPDLALAERDGPRPGGRAWLQDEQALQQAVVARTRGLVRPLLWPEHLPVTRPEYPHGPEAPGKVPAQILTVVWPTPVELDGGSFLVEYRSKDSPALLRVGAYRLKERPVGTETLYEIRGGLRAALVEGNGEVWLWWSEPGRWQPGGAGGEILPAVEYLVYARGFAEDVAGKDVAMGVAEALVALEGPWAYVRGRVSPEVPVLRPTWLPPGFRETRTYASGGSYEVRYTTGVSINLFLQSGLCDTAVAAQHAIERVKVRGVEVFIFRNQEADYRLSACWTEAGRSYSIWTSGGVSRDDLVRIVAGLTPVGMDALTTPPEQLPQTGGMAAPLPLVAAAGAALAGLGVFVMARAVQCRR